MGGFGFIKDKKYAWYPVQIKDFEQGKEATVIKLTYADEQAIWCDGGKAGKSPETLKIKLNDYVGGVLPLQNADSNGNLEVFPDMVELPYLHEAAILFNLKARHADGHPYTRTGDIIVAINPFQWFTEIYTDAVRTEYSNKLVWQNTGEQDPRKFVAPHVYETSCLCFQGLAFQGIDQSILVSGESGAGKTETVKLCMNHIASVQRGPVSEEPTAEGGGKFIDPVVQRVLMSNPLLEAFGNASTLRNDNSSRFGKYTQLQFNNKEAAAKALVNDRSKSYCVIAGSKCDAYLLEKNRITGHGEGERTYHVFYQLILAAPKSKEYWPDIEGTNLDSFKYVGSTTKLKIEGMTDDKHFDNVVETLKLIKVDGDDLRAMMRAICAVMQSGNVTFGPKDGDADQSACTSMDEMKKLAGLVGLEEDKVSLSFTERTMKTRNETYKVPLTPDVAKDSADAFAKEVYGKVFLWLVAQINKATCAEDNYLEGSMSDYTFGIIGLLDIFGFESFKLNRFEQLCINYANEKLQQKFTEDIFLSVQEEYEREGIDLAEITYDDNSDVLALIESKTGLCAMLNEECVRPKGTPEGFVAKVMSSNKKSPCLIPNKLNSRLSFGVHHFAGKVIYTCDDFVSRNQDNLPVDLEMLMQASDNFIVAAKIKEGEDTTAKKPKRAKSSLAGSTVWTKYRQQLTKLMTDLRKTKSKYIRCIKPNQAKVPIKMDHLGTVEQLRCAGVIAAITLANSAFPSKLDHGSTRFQFALMWDQKAFPSTASDSDSEEEKCKKDCDALLTCALKDKEVDGSKVFAVGKTRIYFRSGVLEYLQNRRGEFLAKFVIRIQCMGRMVLAKAAVHKIRYAEQLAKEEAERAEREAKEEAERAEREAREEAEREEREAREAAEAAERAAKEEAEREEREKREAAEKAEREKREAAEKAEREAREEAEREERERREKEEAERIERERKEAERKAKEEAERIERERMEAERAAKEEAERIERERIEAERAAKEKAEEEARQAKLNKMQERMERMKANKGDREAKIKEKKKEKKKDEQTEKEKAHEARLIKEGLYIRESKIFKVPDDLLQSKPDK